MLSWGANPIDPAEATKATPARGRAPFSAALAPAIAWTTSLKSRKGLQRTVAQVGSANFTFSVSIACPPCRGQLPLALDHVYNSRVWRKTATTAPQMSFGVDGDWPAPGWSIGFVSPVRVGSGIAVVVDADCTRHPFMIDGVVTR